MTFETWLAPLIAVMKQAPIAVFILGRSHGDGRRA